jgi:phage baseplate assembly protein W
MMADFAAHFDVPFRWGSNRHAATVQQDDIDDIVSCIQCILRTPVGWRPEAPDFGVPDMAFTTPGRADDIREAILLDEPRASLLITGPRPDDLDELISRIRVEV